MIIFAVYSREMMDMGMSGTLIGSTFSKKTEVSGITLERTVKLMRLTFSRILLQYPEIDVTIDQWVILQLLAQKGVLSQYEIGELSFKDAPTITRMIDLMVAKNYVTREPDDQDKRRFKISLTPDGRSRYDMIKPIVQAFRSRAYDGLSQNDLHVMDKTLHKIFDNLSK